MRLMGTLCMLSGTPINGRFTLILRRSEFGRCPLLVVFLLPLKGAEKDPNLGAAYGMTAPQESSIA